LPKEYKADYRVNILKENITGIEVTCCGHHLGEMRFQNNEGLICPVCGTHHTVTLQYNHFHIRQNQSVKGEDKI